MKQRSLVHVVEDAAMALRPIYGRGGTERARRHAGDLMVVLTRPRLCIADLLLDQTDGSFVGGERFFQNVEVLE